MRTTLKQQLLILAAAITVSLSLSGCKTAESGGVGGNLITPERVLKITRLASYASATAMIFRDPNSAPLIDRAKNGFCQMKESGTWDLAQAVVLANQNGLNFLDSSEGQVIIGGLPLLIDTFMGQQFDLREQPYAIAFINGACDGLSLAVGPGVRANIGDPTKATLEYEAKLTRPVRR